MEVTNEEFFSFVGGRADPEVKRRIALELEDSSSNVRRLLAKFAAISERPCDADWQGLLTAHEDDGRPQEIIAPNVAGQAASWQAPATE
jgi:hypothetical protein